MSATAVFDEYQRQWIRCIRPAPDAAVTMVCFPHAGGSSTYYRPIFGGLPPYVSVLSVQYPGRQDRIGEPCLEDVDTLTSRIVKALLPLADRRLVFFGHSMGAIIAYEVALELERVAGRVLDDLFVSGRPAPSRQPLDRVHLRGDQAILARVRKLSGSQARILEHPEVLDMSMPALRADCKAIETYQWRPGSRLRTPIHALVGDDDPVASIEDVRAWQHHTSGPFDLRIYPGGHFFLDERPAEIAAVVSAAVDPALPV
jgi:pyochelin biosynthetic protein PchC